MHCNNTCKKLVLNQRLSAKYLHVPNLSAIKACWQSIASSTTSPKPSVTVWLTLLLHCLFVSLWMKVSLFKCLGLCRLRVCFQDLVCFGCPLLHYFQCATCLNVMDYTFAYSEWSVVGCLIFLHQAARPWIMSPLSAQLIVFFFSFSKQWVQCPIATQLVIARHLFLKCHSLPHIVHQTF